MSRLDEKKAARFRLLKALYDASGADQFKCVPLFDLGEEVGLNHEETDQAGEYLQKEGLLEFKAFGPQIGITHRGVKEVEEALEYPDRSTRHFLPVGGINIGMMVGSTIHASHSGEIISIGGDVIGSAVGTHSSLKVRDIITKIQKSAMDTDLKEKFAAAAEELLNLKINEADKSDAADDLIKLQVELEKPTKDEGRIQKIWNRIEDMVPTIASILASTATLAKVVSSHL